jgi:multimeric flavodoxin WrbA
MSQPIVLVTFYSRWGWTEKLALAAAVGAVQARALIRLRRVPDVGVTASSDANPAIMRMQKEYVAPIEADILNAHALILAAPAGLTTSSPEWTTYLELLGNLAAAGKLKGKIGAVVDTANETTVSSFKEAIGRFGLMTPPPIVDIPDEIGRATALGRSVGAQAKTTLRLE